MLPDYPKIKTRIAEVYRDQISHVTNVFLGIFSEAKPTQMHEGGKHILVREDGSVDEIKPKHVEAVAELRLDIREVDKAGGKGCVEDA
jgi:hypothetical protein